MSALIRDWQVSRGMNEWPRLPRLSVWYAFTTIFLGLMIGYMAGGALFSSAGLETLVLLVLALLSITVLLIEWSGDLQKMTTVPLTLERYPDNSSAQSALKPASKMDTYYLSKPGNWSGQLPTALSGQHPGGRASGDVLGERMAELAALYEQFETKEALCRQLLGTVLTAQEEERTRLARELHDTIGQSLTAIIMTTAAVEKNLPPDFASGKEQLAGVRAVARQALQDLRNLIFDLRPDILDDLGLTLAVRNQAKKYLEAAGVQVRFRMAITDELSPEVEITVFRVVQEAITNIFRHAEATEVYISLTNKSGRLIVRVEDDGRGFDPAQVMKGQRHCWGLHGMKERINLLGGKFYVGSRPGSGTLVMAEVPLET
jgi:signal transduction histidine kinase